MGFCSESFLPQLRAATSTCSFPLQGRHGGAGASPQHVYYYVHHTALHYKRASLSVCALTFSMCSPSRDGVAALTSTFEVWAIRPGIAWHRTAWHLTPVHARHPSLRPSLFTKPDDAGVKSQVS